MAAGWASTSRELAGDLFAIALLDASMIGASAVGPSTAYASADVLGFNHSLHRPIKKAKGFYASYAGLMAVSAALVIVPGVPLGLSDRGRADAGRRAAPERGRLPAAALQRQGRARSLGERSEAQRPDLAIVWVLVLLSIILTASVLFPNISGSQIEVVLGAGAFSD